MKKVKTGTTLSSPSASGRSARHGATTEPTKAYSRKSRKASEEQHSIAPEYEARSKTPRYTRAECAALLDRPENPFFMFGVDARLRAEAYGGEPGRFQIWENYRDGLLSREDAVDRLYEDRWGV